MGLIICGLVFGLDQLRILNSVKYQLESGLWRVDRQVAEISRRLAMPVEWVQQSFARQDRIARLEDQLALAAVDQQRMKAVEAQIEMLKAMTAEYGGEVRANTVAEMFSREGITEIGGGSINGILSGMAVTDKNGVLVGRVEAVGRYVSRVERVGTAGGRSRRLHV